MRFKRNIVGKKIMVAKAKNTVLEGIEGLVLDETMNTILINCGGVQKTILKRGCVFKIEDDLVDGEELYSRPEDRIKN